MRVLVACEESQAVCSAFRERGHEAYSCDIQPCSGGHPFKKKTCLWLKGLPELKPTTEIPKELCQSTKIAGNWFNHGGKDRQANRAKTFPGIAKAMAEQWGGEMIG